MTKTGPEIRHDAKARMEKYRKEMTDKGYISTTIFLSKEHRAELKRLGDEHRLTRVEAAEHIFQIYLQSDNKDVTQINNINIDQQTELSTAIEDLKVRVTALEERDSKQAERIKELSPAVEDICLQTKSDDKGATQTDNTNTETQGQRPAKPSQETQAEIPEPEDKSITRTYNINAENQVEPPGAMPEPEYNDGNVLELEIELDDSEDIESQIDELGTVIEQPVDTPGAVVIDGLVLEPDDSVNKDTTQTDNTNIEQGVETLAKSEYPETIEPIDSSHAGRNEDQAPEGGITPPAGDPPGAMPDQPTGEPIPDILAGIDPENLTIEDRDRFVLKLHEQFPGRTQAKNRIKVLNDAGILLNGKPWTTKQFSDQLNLARKRAKK